MNQYLTSLTDIKNKRRGILKPEALTYSKKYLSVQLHMRDGIV